MNQERFARIQRLLAMRQPDLTVCLEQVNKPHNLAAMIRTCDAVGIHDVHAVWPEEMRMNNYASKGSHYWVRLNRHETITEAVDALRGQGMQILATHLSPQQAAVASAEGVVLPDDWDADNVDWSVGSAASQCIGDDWLARGTSLLLRVPSVVVPVGWNYLLNPAHPDARRVRTQRIEYRPDVRLW